MMSKHNKVLEDFAFDNEDSDFDLPGETDGVADIIVNKYKEDIAEILSQAYNDVSMKIDSIVEALQPGE